MGVEISDWSGSNLSNRKGQGRLGTDDRWRMHTTIGLGNTSGIFDAVIDAALKRTEIADKLEELAAGDEERLGKVREALLDHLRAQREELRRIVAAEDAQYSDSRTRFLSLVNDRLPTSPFGPQLVAAREAEAAGRRDVDESRTRLQDLYSRLLKARSEHAQANMAHQVALAESKQLEKSKASRISLRDRAVRLFDGAARHKRALDGTEQTYKRLEQEVKVAQEKHEALAREVANTVGDARQIELRAARVVTERIDEDAELQLSQHKLTAAREALRRAILEKAVLPEMREWITDVLTTDRLRPYRLTFDLSDTSGLTHVTAPEHEVPTKAFNQLDNILAHLGGGSVGISGPRGSGKTTLIRARCAAETHGASDVVGVMVAAPVEYEPREFLTHLYAELCLKAAPEAQVRMRDGQQASGSTPFIIYSVGALATVAGAGLIARALLNDQPRDALIATLSITAAMLLVYALRRSKPQLARNNPVIDSQYAPSASVRGGTRYLAHRPLAVERLRLDPALVVTLLGMILSLFAVVPPIPGTVGFPPPPSFVVFVGIVVMLATGVVFEIWMSPVHRGGWRTLSITCAALGFALLILATSAAPDDEQALRLAGVLALLSCGYAVVAPLSAHLRVGDSYAASRAGTTFGTMLLTVTIGVSVAVAWSVTPSPQAVWGAALLGFGLSLIGSKPSRDQPRPQLNAADSGALRVATAADALRRIRFQQTTSRGWSSALKLGALAGSPLTAEHSATGGVSLAQLPVTYPELVADFHAYIRTLTGDGDTVIIGIDELDKLSAGAADRFMNGVKAIFDGAIPGCYYLVSISEEALASFEQRGLIARNVFDSAFDAMLKVDYLDLEGTIALLGKRLIDLPRGIAALCHALSGGLARDVIRFMRLAARVRGQHDSISLAELSKAVCNHELLDRLNGLSIASQSLDNWRDVRDLGSWARALDLDDVTSLQDVPPALLEGRRGSQRDAALDLLRIHACSFYQLATVNQFFAAADSDRIREAEQSYGAGAIQRLAEARNEIGSDVARAWQAISDFRSHWKLTP